MESFTMQNKAVVIIAKRNSGKSYLLKSMLQYSIKIKEFDKIYCISPTEKINKFYSNIIQEQCIFELYSEEWVLRLIEKMSKLNEGKTEQSQNPINCLLVLDDCCVLPSLILLIFSIKLKTHSSLYKSNIHCS